MPESLIIELGRCGIGHSKGPPRLIRLGLFQVALAPRGLIARLSHQERVLKRCRRVLWLIARRAVCAHRMAHVTGKGRAMLEVDETFMSEIDEAMGELSDSSRSDEGGDG